MSAEAAQGASNAERRRSAFYDRRQRLSPQQAALDAQLGKIQSVMTAGVNAFAR